MLDRVPEDSFTTVRDPKEIRDRTMGDVTGEKGWGSGDAPA